MFDWIIEDIYSSILAIKRLLQDFMIFFQSHAIQSPDALINMELSNPIPAQSPIPFDKLIEKGVSIHPTAPFLMY